MDREEAIQKQRLLEENLDDAKSVLSQIPGVAAVGIGLKETGGEFTDQISYRIYVPVKKDPADLAPDEIIPRAVNGIPTDVLTPLVLRNARFQTGVCVPERATFEEYRPLRAGIMISPKSNPEGTLGWFGKLDDGTIVLLTASHVLYEDKTFIRDPAKKIDRRKLKTAQPKLGCKCKCLCCECGNDHVIGETIIGIQNTSTDSATSVDCAIARINPDLAKNIILRITNNETTEVLSVRGTAAAVVGDKVRKIGARSAFTRGKVVHLGDIAVAPPVDEAGIPMNVVKGQVLIVPAPGEQYQLKDIRGCRTTFSNAGDSGAVVLNDDNKIIALIWATDGLSSDFVGITVACHIQNVLDQLGANGFPITLLQSPAGDSESFSEQAIQPPEIEAAANTPETTDLEMLRDANKKSLLYKLYEKHHEEIFDLINHSRPVTVAWRRSQGPAYIAAISRSVREEAYKIPYAVNEVSREHLLARLRTALMSRGSEALKEDIEKFGDDLAAAAKTGDTVQQLSENLKEAGFIDVLSSSSVSEFV
jgi:hypothetical protein